MKNARQGEILNIIRTRDVDTQEQLLAELRQRGFSATQATISRDIKELRLVKELMSGGGYRYTVSERKAAAEDTRLRNILGMVGSLAGDDTGILIMRDSQSAQQFSSEVHKLLK